MITWSRVRGFGNIKYFNVSYLILFIVPVLLEFHYRAANSSEFFKNVVAFPVTLRWLYGASLCYATAIALYQFFCPIIIKEFGSVEKYVLANCELFSRSNPQHKVNVVLAHLDPKIDATLESLIKELMDEIARSSGADRTGSEDKLKKLVDGLHPDAVQRFLTKAYQSDNVRSAIALWISFISYLTGTVILIVLLFRKSYQVFLVW